MVKILKIDPAPSPASEYGCGCTVWPAARFSPYVRLLAIAITRWASRPGRITLITLATPSAVGEATLSTAFFTLSCTCGSRLVRIR